MSIEQQETLDAILRQSATYPTSSTQSPFAIPQLVQQARLFKFTMTANF